MKITFSFFGCVFLLLLTGCNTTTSRQYVPLPDQSKQVADPAKGRIYVLRPASGVWETAGMKISEGGQFIGVTKPHSFVCWEISPGEIIITGNAEGISQTPLTVEAGHVYYIFQHLRMGLAKAENHLDIIDEKEGREVLKKCRAPDILPLPWQSFEVESAN